MLKIENPAPTRRKQRVWVQWTCYSPALFDQAQLTTSQVSEERVFETAVAIITITLSPGCQEPGDQTITHSLSK